MLLSKVDLYDNNKNTTGLNNETTTIEQSKLERIISYINEQQFYTLQYQSPNQPHPSSNNSSESSSVIILEPKDNDISSLFSASISQVMARKHQQENQNPSSLLKKPLVLSSTSINQQHNSKVFTQKENISPPPPTILHDNRPLSSIHQRRQQHHHQPKRRQSRNVQHNHKELSNNKSVISEKINTSQSKNMNLPQTRANGFHLLHKFVSPNLEVNRITIKFPNAQNKRPKLGLFNKGKSSSKATKPVPDLVFSESKFLKPNSNESNIKRFATTKSILSAYFQQQQSNYIHNIRGKRNSISKYFTPNNTKQHGSHHPVSLSYHNNSQAKAPISPQEEQYVSHSSLRNYSAAGPISHIDSKEKSIALSSHNKKKRASIVSALTSSSNKSLENLLKECKYTLQVPSSFDYHGRTSGSSHQLYNNHPNNTYNHGPVTTRNNASLLQQQVPTYARVKTPTSVKNVLTTKREHNINNDHETILIESSNDDNSSSIHVLEQKETEYNLLATTRHQHYNQHENTDTNFQYKNYMYDSEEEEDQVNVRKGNHKIFYNNLVDEWQVENSLISFSANNSRNDAVQSNNDDDGIFDKQTQESNEDNVVNFWRDQQRRKL